MLMCGTHQRRPHFSELSTMLCTLSVPVFIPYNRQTPIGFPTTVLSVPCFRCPLLCFPLGVKHQFSVVKQFLIGLRFINAHHTNSAIQFNYPLTLRDTLTFTHLPTVTHTHQKEALTTSHTAHDSHADKPPVPQLTPAGQPHSLSLAVSHYKVFNTLISFSC